MVPNKPIFIVGVPRSGTTLLAQLLNASGQIYFPFETHFFQLVNNKTWMQKEDGFSAFFSSKLNHYEQYYGYSLAEKRLLRQKTRSARTKREFLSIICQYEANKKRVERWGEKTPGHIAHINDILESFPECKIVAIIRDPRDIYLSMLKVPWGLKNVYKIVKRYKTSYQKVLKYRKMFSDSILIVKYEDLIKKPEYTIKYLYTDCGLEYKKSIFDNFSHKNNINFDKKREPWKLKNQKSNIDKNNLEKWKYDTKKRSNEFSFISWYLKTEIKLFDYEEYNQNSNIFNFLYYNASYLNYFRLKIKRKLKKLLDRKYIK